MDEYIDYQIKRDREEHQLAERRSLEYAEFEGLVIPVRDICSCSRCRSRKIVRE